MTVQEIITTFELQVDDLTELSSAEELALFNAVLQETVFNKVWSIFKTSVTGTVVSNEITLPTDFAYLYVNRNYTGNMTENQRPVVFIGSTYQPYTVINFEERRQYRNTRGYVYIDMANNKLVFTQTPEDTAYEFDYIKVPPTYILTDTPAFPSRFHKKFVYDMATQDSIIQMSDKAATMAEMNRMEAKRYFDALCMWDSKQQMM